MRMLRRITKSWPRARIMTIPLAKDLCRLFQCLCVPSIRLPSDRRSSRCRLRQPFWTCLSWSACTYPKYPWAIRRLGQHEKRGASDVPSMLPQTKLPSPLPTCRTPLAAVLPARVASGKRQVYSFQLGLPRWHPQCPLRLRPGLHCSRRQGQRLGTFVQADQMTLVSGHKNCSQPLTAS